MRQMDMVARIQLLTKIARICYEIERVDMQDSPPWDEAEKEKKDEILRYVESSLARLNYGTINSYWDAVIEVFRDDLGDKPWSVTALHLPTRQPAL